MTISTLKDQLSALEEKQCGDTSEVQRLTTMLGEREQELERSKNDLFSASQQHAKAAEKVVDLEQDVRMLSRAQREAEKVPSLLQDSQTNAARIYVLEGEINELRGSLREQTQRRSEEEKEAESLKDQLKSAAKAGQHVKVLQEEARRNTEELDTMYKKLREAEKAAAVSNAQAKELQQKKDQIDALTDRLAIATKCAVQIPELEAAKLHWLQKCNVLQQADKESCETKENLRSEIKLKDQEMTVLTGQLVAAEETRTQLASAQEACQQKDTQLSALQAILKDFDNVKQRKVEKDVEVLALRGMSREIETLKQTNAEKDATLLGLRDKASEIEVLKRQTAEKDLKLSASREISTRFEALKQSNADMDAELVRLRARASESEPEKQTDAEKDTRMLSLEESNKRLQVELSKRSGTAERLQALKEKLGDMDGLRREIAEKDVAMLALQDEVTTLKAAGSKVISDETAVTSALQEKISKMESSRALEQFTQQKFDFSQGGGMSEGTMLPIAQVIRPKDLQLTIADRGSQDTSKRQKSTRRSIQLPRRRDNRRHSAVSTAGTTSTEEPACIPETQPEARADRTTPDTDASQEENTATSPVSEAESLFPAVEHGRQISVYFPEGESSTREDMPISQGMVGEARACNAAMSQPSQKVPVNFDSISHHPSRREKGIPSSGRSSSSYGEAMLLEDFEQLEESDNRSAAGPLELSSHSNFLKPPLHSPKINLCQKAAARLAPPQSTQGQHQQSHGVGAQVKNRKDPSPRRLRSGCSGPTKSTPLGQRPESTLNIQASPRGGVSRERHLPNSAAKRRLESEESHSSPQMSTLKRLKRNSSALDVKKPAKQTPASFDYARAASARSTKPSEPSGGRKGSIVGTNAPAPGRSQKVLEKPRKNSKVNKYESRFGPDGP